jgi:DNA-binding response OmpR family regulator
MGNAIKFTERGEIQIIVKKEENIHDDKVRAPLPGISIYVQDTGIGIKKESLPYIFDDYKQVDGSLTRKTGGTGLGLALVKRFSQLLGGNVSVESEYEKGTTFRIRLPEDVNQITEKEPVETKHLDLSRKTVVLYETTEADTALQKAAFEQNGFEVHVAKSVEEGFTLAKEQYPRLIVLDILAFDARGIDLIKKIKGNYYTKDIRFCFSRLYNQRKYGYVFDVVDFVYKPVNKELVSRIINLAARACTQLKNILVIDHDEGAREAMHDLLLQEGDFSVRIARDMNETIAMLKKQQPDVIFFNLFLPEAEGYKLVAEIGTSKKWADIPVICIVPKMLDATQLRQPSETIAFLPEKSDLKMEQTLRKIVTIASDVVI